MCCRGIQKMLLKAFQQSTTIVQYSSVGTVCRAYILATKNWLADSVPQPWPLGCCLHLHCILPLVCIFVWSCCSLSSENVIQQGMTWCIGSGAISSIHSGDVLMTYCICYRPSDLAIEIDQVLDRCYKQSRAVDTESLCIVAGEKVSNSFDAPISKSPWHFLCNNALAFKQLGLCWSVDIWRSLTCSP